MLPFHTLGHEPAVGFAAGARFRGSISAAVATQGAGAFNLVNWRFAEPAGPLNGDGVRVATRRTLADALACFVAGFKAARERPVTSG